MGDLSGGQIMQDMLIRTLGLGAESLAFYRFPGIADLTAYKELIRRDLDDAGREIADPASVAAEAAAAFRHNIEISMAVAGHLQGVA
jgi:heme oxygenase